MTDPAKSNQFCVKYLYEFHVMTPCEQQCDYCREFQIWAGEWLPLAVGHRES